MNKFDRLCKSRKIRGGRDELVLSETQTREANGKMDLLCCCWVLVGDGVREV